MDGVEVVEHPVLQPDAVAVFENTAADAVADVWALVHQARVSLRIVPALVQVVVLVRRGTVGVGGAEEGEVELGAGAIRAGSAAAITSPDPLRSRLQWPPEGSLTTRSVIACGESAKNGSCESYRTSGR
jgi:hypothetical protein